MAFKGKKGPSYSAAEKRAYYIGYGMGLAGHDITEDRVQNVVVRQSSNVCQESMIRGVMDSSARKKQRRK